MAGSDWFDATFGAGPEGALLLDRDGRVARSNLAFRELLDLTDDPRGQPLAALLASSGEVLDRAWRTALEERRAIELEGVFLESAGRKRRETVDAEFHPQSDRTGTVGGVLMVVRSRARSTEELSDSSRLFYQAFLHSTNAMELTDREGYLLDVNPAFERIYGYRKEEVLGRRPNLVASGRTDPMLYARMWRDLLDPRIGAWSGEVVNRDRRGIDHPVLLAITAIRAPDGSITHFLGVSVDLTERRAWERAAIHSERLFSLGQLAAGVAHEINTPLANIMMIAESIRRRNNDPWTRGRIDSLLQQSESAAKIVRGLLDFAHRPDTKVGEVDLGQLVTNSVGFLKGKQSADVEVELDLPDDPVVVHGDREQITQVIVNLLNNAYDALDGHGHVTVRVFATDDSAHVAVSDNGPGIPAEVQTHLFEPFFTTKPEGKGTGLGIAICHGIVQSHGGTIEVDSAPGRGATFEVRLPRSSPPAPSPAGGSE